MHVIDHQVSFLYLTLLPPGQFMKNHAQLPPQLSIQYFLPTFRDKHHMIFAFSCRVFQRFIRLHLVSFRKL